MAMRLRPNAASLVAFTHIRECLMSGSGAQNWLGPRSSTPATSIRPRNLEVENNNQVT